MAKKEKTNKEPNTIITIILKPGGIIRDASIRVEKGDTASVGLFKYQTMGEIFNAISDQLDKLVVTQLPDIETSNEDAYEGTPPGLIGPFHIEEQYGLMMGDDWLKEMLRRKHREQLVQFKTPPQVEVRVKADKRPPTDVVAEDAETAQLSLF